MSTGPVVRLQGHDRESTPVNPALLANPLQTIVSATSRDHTPQPRLTRCEDAYAQSRGERTLLQMRSHFRNHRGRHLARYLARTRVDSRQPLQLATQIEGVANNLFPHGIEPARRRAVRVAKNPANRSARGMTEKSEVLYFGLIGASQPAKQAMEFADPPQAPFENSLMSGK